MNQSDVIVGQKYRTKIGDEIAIVVVMQKWSGSHTRRTTFVVRRENETRALPKNRTAGALRPL